MNKLMHQRPKFRAKPVARRLRDSKRYLKPLLLSCSLISLVSQASAQLGTGSAPDIAKFHYANDQSRSTIDFSNDASYVSLASLTIPSSRTGASIRYSSWVRKIGTGGFLSPYNIRLAGRPPGSSSLPPSWPTVGAGRSNITNGRPVVTDTSTNAAFGSGYTVFLLATNPQSAGFPYYTTLYGWDFKVRYYGADPTSPDISAVRPGHGQVISDWPQWVDSGGTSRDVIDGIAQAITSAPITDVYFTLQRRSNGDYWDATSWETNKYKFTGTFQQLGIGSNGFPYYHIRRVGGLPNLVDGEYIFSINVKDSNGHLTEYYSYFEANV